MCWDFLKKFLYVTQLYKVQIVKWLRVIKFFKLIIGKEKSWKFCFYSYSEKLLYNNMSSENPIKYFISGGFGGICTVIAGHPLDTIKVNMFYLIYW